MQDRSRLPWVPLLVTLALALCACGGKSKGDSTEKLMSRGDDDGKVPKVDPTLCETEGKRVATFDLNRDNRPDVWKLYKTIKEGEANLEILSCKQVDLNHDGNKDYVIGYSRKGGAVFEKFDFDFDGKFDAFYQFNEKTAKVFEVQRESGFDGRYDIQEVYDADGGLTSVRHDRNGDGEPDMWEQYVKGELVAILYDDDYDKKVDRREEVKENKGPVKQKTSVDDETPDGENPDGDSADGDGADPDGESGDGEAADDQATGGAEDAGTP